VVDRGVGHPDRGRAGQQVPARGAGRVEPLGLEHRADDPRRIGQLGERHAVDAGIARGGRDEPDDHPQGRGLARPVGPEKARDDPGLHGERHPVHGDDRTEPLAQPLDGDAPAPIVHPIGTG
jgi:hypothetical protein